MSKLFVYLLLQLTTSSLLGQVSYLTNSPGNGGFNSSAPQEFTYYNGYVYFNAVSDIGGSELWRSDGTPAGTTLFYELGGLSKDGNPQYFTVFNGTLYFVADSPTGLDQIWRTDGTHEGTYRIFEDALVAGMKVFNNKLYFIAQDPQGPDPTIYTSIYHLYRSDGSVGGAEMLQSPTTFVRMASNLVVHDSMLYFAAAVNNLGTWDYELWRTDTSLVGIQSLGDLNPEGSSIYLNNSEWEAGSVGEYLVYTARNEITATNGSYDSYVISNSDSTPQLLYNFYNDAQKPSLNYTLLNGVLFFAGLDPATGTYRLYRTDGTTTGTTIVANYNLGWYTDIGTFGSQIYFTANGGGNVGWELFKTDGTAAGTACLKDLYSGASSGAPTLFCSTASALFFTATSNNYGRELWKTVGTTSSTVRLTDLAPGGASSTPENLAGTPLGLFFGAGSIYPSNREPFVSNGTTAGTVLLADICSNKTDTYLTEGIQIDSLIYVASLEPLVSQGTAASTHVLAEINTTSYSEAHGFIKYQDMAIFHAKLSNGTERVFRTNGTTGVTQISPGSNSPGGISQFLNGSYIFNAGGGMYSYDGASAAVVGGTGSMSESLTSGQVVSNNRLFYAYSPQISRGELYSTDVSGTIFHDINPNSTIKAYPTGITALNNGVVFSAYNPTVGTELWFSDGTTTQLVKDISLVGDSRPAHFAQLGSQAFFAADDGVSGRELWRTDGTEIGTYLVADLHSGPRGSNILGLTKFNNHIYFTYDSEDYGFELFRIDSLGNVELVSDIYPGPGGSNPENFQVLNDTLYFAADDHVHGIEPFYSTGEVCFTHLFYDINPGFMGSYPNIYGNLEGSLILAGQTQSEGVELLSVRPLLNAIIDTVFSCTPYFWSEGNQLLSAPGLYTSTVPGSTGCDSIIAKYYQFTGSITIDDQVVCDSLLWVDGITYYSSTNTPTFTFNGSNGCDSIVYLNLSVHHVSDTVISVTACDSYTWDNGITYIESDTIQSIYSLAPGCDSTVTLILTINHSFRDTTVVESCNPYTWIDGNTYTSTATAQYPFVGSNGCDSVYYLNYINHTHTYYQNQHAVNSYYWSTLDSILTISGTYYDTLTNQYGCDSIKVLTLTIIPFTTNLFTLPTQLNACTGIVRIHTEEPGIYYYYIDSAYWEMGVGIHHVVNRCAGTKYISTDGPYNNLIVTPYVMVDSTHYFEYNVPAGTVYLDSIGYVDEFCLFNPNDIDSAQIVSSTINGTELQAVWWVYNEGVALPVNSVYQIPLSGTYLLQLQLYCLQKNDPGGFVANAGMYVDENGAHSLLGFTELSQESIQIFPNPTSDRVRIFCPGENLKVRVLSPAGQILFMGDLVSGEELDLSAWTSGVYTLEVKTDRTRMLAKIVKI